MFSRYVPVRFVSSQLTVVRLYFSWTGGLGGYLLCGDDDDVCGMLFVGCGWVSATLHLLISWTCCAVHINASSL